MLLLVHISDRRLAWLLGLAALLAGGALLALAL